MLSQRQAQLLDFMVREYVKSAEPVGSALVCSHSDLAVSPATIRNEMQELEELGYLAQPHTSAGRIPTDRAYRWFVNNLLASGHYDAEPKAKRHIEETLTASDREPHAINKAAAQVLHELSDNLVIANIEESDDFYKTGLSGLMEFPEFREMRAAFPIMSFFDQFDRMFNELEQQFFGGMGRAHGLNVFIGRENQAHEIQNEAIICARYRLPGRHIGSLTMIGPIRMDYRKNLGLISYVTDVLNHIANE